jgi:hypothetical protein
MGKATAAVLVETNLYVIGVDLRDAAVMVALGAAAHRAPVGGVRAIVGETIVGSSKNSYMVGQVIVIDGGKATNRGDEIW